MAVFRHLMVDIPKEHVIIERQNNGKPALIKYVIAAPYDRNKGYAKPKRTTIGHQCLNSKTKMHPTSQYAEIYPDSWKKVSNQQVKPIIKRIGIFTAMQAINMKTGIKDIVDSVYGVDKSDGIMDHVMYSIIHHTNETSAITNKMRDELTYVKTPYSDTWYSKLFEKDMTKEQELQLKKLWAMQCKEEGVDSVWLCIDGSNDDCQSKGVELAEKGHAKSHKNIDIVSFTYAVAKNGKPVTFDVYRGGLVDKKAMKSIIDFLNECGISVEGVILDRGYCDSDVIKYLTNAGIDYVIMLKGNSEGYEKIVNEHASEIKMNFAYFVPYTHLFGYQESIQVFKNYDHKDYITLFFDYRNASSRIETLLNNTFKQACIAQKQLDKGNDASIDNKYKDLLSIDPQSNEITFNTMGLQKEVDKKGLYGIITSREMKPKEVHDLYSCRDASETQYMQVKTQLGYGTIRVHYTQGVRSKFTIGFIASIARYEIELAAKTVNKSVNQFVTELEKIEAQKINDVYTHTHIENERYKLFFKYFDADLKELVEESVKFENDRLAGRVPVPRKRKTGPKKGSHHKKYDENGNVIPKKTGVSKGTKRGKYNKDGSLRKKPGVKKGTKRNDLKKDGTPRKKPGPKPKKESFDNN